MTVSRKGVYFSQTLLILLEVLEKYFKGNTTINFEEIKEMKINEKYGKVQFTILLKLGTNRFINLYPKFKIWRHSFIFKLNFFCNASEISVKMI